MKPPCTFQGCDREQHALTFCYLHYRRQWEYGSPADPRPSVEQRFWAKVEKTDTCWRWTGAIGSGGYGSFWDGWCVVKAHRWLWEKVRGPIPAGMQIDHLCRNRWCVNPDHLEPVTPQTNVLRGVGMGARYAARTHCANGHELSGENLIVNSRGRQCKICSRATDRERLRAWRAKKRAA